MMTLFIDGIGIFSPGMPDWPSAQPMLRDGTLARDVTCLPPPASLLLPATERRRAGASVNLALEIAAQACRHANIDPAHLTTVFASSSGDTQVLNDICETLASPERELSPTRFHNSVHNAAAGYWHIAVQSHQPSTSIAWHQHTAGSGLLEASTQATLDQTPVLLALYDTPFPFPIARIEPIAHRFGCALVLQPTTTAQSVARVHVHYDAGKGAVSTCASVYLETLRTSTPAAHILPLLVLLAEQRSGTVTLAVPTQGRIMLDVEPLHKRASA